MAYLSSIQATLYKSARQVMYSGGGAGSIPGQYVPQLLSWALDAVVTYICRSSGINPSKILPLSQASTYNTCSYQPLVIYLNMLYAQNNWK